MDTQRHIIEGETIRLQIDLQYDELIEVLAFLKDPVYVKRNIIKKYMKRIKPLRIIKPTIKFDPKPDKGA